MDKSTPDIYRKAQALYISGACQALSKSANRFTFLVDEDNEGVEVELFVDVEADELTYYQEGKPIEANAISLAALMQLVEELQAPQPQPKEGKVYTREGMIKRVLKERQQKAAKADYRIEFAHNIYGEHRLINEKGVQYRVTLRDFEQETGYIDNPDLKTNKLGTTKHIMFAFNYLKNNPAPAPEKAREMEAIMNNGLEFLSGLFKMATGSSQGLEGKKMEYDEATGEVVMRFKLPSLSILEE